MILIFKTEFRGKSEKQNDSGLHKYVNLEDGNGESAKFSCDSGIDLTKFKKGDQVTAEIDYNLQYKSLKVVNLYVTK